MLGSVNAVFRLRVDGNQSSVSESVPASPEGARNHGTPDLVPSRLKARQRGRRPGGGHGSGVPVAVRPPGRVSEPSLQAGPVWADVPRRASAAGLRTAEDDLARLAALAELAARYLAGDWGWPC
jgi:hypothetical protein